MLRIPNLSPMNALPVNQFDIARTASSRRPLASLSLGQPKAMKVVLTTGTCAGDFQWG
jgi:hypothetical protein